MELTVTILAAVMVATTAFYLLQVYKFDLQMMQQNSYRNDRYFKWWRMSKDYASMSRISDLAVFLLLVSMFPKVVTLPIAIIVFAIKAAILLKKKYKKPLVMTKRVWRLLSTMIVATLVVAALSCSPHADAGINITAAGAALTAIAVLSWGVLALCNAAMQPVEKSINNNYVNDARRIIGEMPSLKVVGITGSYGKTSTKHYLNRILSEQFNVVMTPGSFNTPMGVTRTIREMLKPYTEIFICEMGAKQRGDIKEICDIVHPQYGIITAVGEQHMESFKSIENVQRTKFELADALPADGFCVVNDDFPYVANREVDNTSCLRYAVQATANADYTARNIEYSEHGTRFDVADKKGGTVMSLETRLVGECNISNLLAAVIMAMKLGVPADKIRYAVSQIEQVEHRLNMKRTPGGVTIIDDAFNSNPHGSRMALDVLARMTRGKRIVVTPGMIELGNRQQALNEAFGEHIAETVDVAIVVGQYNRDAIVEGIKKSGTFNDDNLIVVDSFAEAQQRLASLLQMGDTVLYENDLPDTFK